MSRSLNRVQLIGNLGKDPESRYLPSGGAVVNFTMATTDSWTDKSTGEAKERTEWHTIVAFNKLAEIIGQYLKKGSKAFIEGSLRTRKWEDKEGKDRYTTEIVADQLIMLGDPRRDGEREERPPPGAGVRHPRAPAREPATAATGGRDFEDDDIPFAKRHWKES